MLRSNDTNNQSEKPNSLVGASQHPVGDSQHKAWNIQLSVEETKLGRKKPSKSRIKPTSSLVEENQVPVGYSQHYAFLTYISAEKFGTSGNIPYLCPRYKHIVKPLCMTWTDCNPLRTYIYTNIGGSLFPHCQQRSRVCSRTPKGCRLCSAATSDD